MGPGMATTSIGEMKATISADVSQMEAELDRMIVKAEYLRSLLVRPWWCPYWIYRKLNGGL